MKEWIDKSVGSKARAKLENIIQTITSAKSFSDLLAAVNRIRDSLAKNGAFVSQLECQRILEVVDAIFRSLEQEKMFKANGSRQKKIQGAQNQDMMSAKSDSFSLSASRAAATSNVLPPSLIEKPLSPRFHGTSQLAAMRNNKLQKVKGALREDVVRALNDTFTQLNALSILESARADAVAEAAQEIELCDRIRNRSERAVKEAWEKELHAKRLYLDLRSKRKKLGRALREAHVLQDVRASEKDKLIALKGIFEDEKSRKRKSLLKLGEQPPCDSGGLFLPPSEDVVNTTISDEESSGAGHDHASNTSKTKRKRSIAMLESSSSIPPEKKRRTLPNQSADTEASFSKSKGTSLEQDSLEAKWLFEEGHSYFYGLRQHPVDRVRGRLMIVTACRLNFPLAKIMCMHYGWSNEVRNITPQPDLAKRQLYELYATNDRPNTDIDSLVLLLAKEPERVREWNS
eukprot:g171.t1